MIICIFGSFTVFANDLTPDERALMKIYELASVLDGKYFTVTRSPCGNNACSYCHNLNVTACDWFVDLFGYSVAKKQMSYQHFPNNTTVAPSGWSCFSFSVFAHWYIFSPSNDGVIGNNVSLVASYANNRSVRFNYETLAGYARPGDMIRISRSCGGHSVIFVSCDEEGVMVLDSNYVDNNKVALHKIPYTARYGSSQISFCGISITRANNYDTVTTGTDCAALGSDSAIEFTDITAPTTLVPGRGFALGGSIKSGKLLKSVRVKIVDAKTGISVFDYTANPDLRTYKLAGSEIDKNTKFGTLKRGIYYLEYVATDNADYSRTYRSNCFSVHDQHYCSFGEGVVENGQITYTCGICGRFEIYNIPSDEPPSEPEGDIGGNLGTEPDGGGLFPDLPSLGKPDEEEKDEQTPASPPANTGVLGDVNGSGKTDADDAVYLLYACFFGAEQYPLVIDCDYDKSGVLDSSDAIHLLYHVFFGDSYPIN